MGKLQDVLRGFADVTDRLEDAQARGETDPLRIVDAILGGEYVRTDSAAGEKWWELFGLDAPPSTKAELRTAWKKWASRNHPDQGHHEPAYRFMRTLYEKQVATLAE